MERVPSDRGAKAVKYAKPIKPLEVSFLHIAESLLAEYAEKLKKAGLGAEPPEIAVRNENETQYESEISIYIHNLADDQICDFIEEHVFWHGKQHCSESDFERWLREQLSAMCQI
jgi:hypothetical protein